MNWFWANWYQVNAGVAVLAFSILAAYWNHFDLVQRCIIANFAVMNLHHWEEFGFPGGFAGLCNSALYGSDRPAHYPLNQLIAAFGNNWFNYFYAFATNLVAIVDWMWAIVFAMANYYIIFYKVGIGYIGSKTTPYAFTKEDMDRYNPSLWSPSVWLAFYRDNWYYFTAAAFVISTFTMGFFGDCFTRLQTILIYNLMALFVQQVEEYILPEGGPLVINVAFYGERKNYDRFPGNKLSMAWVNTLAYPFYISAVVFSDQI
ncbi:hypothetical protein KJ359_008543 [Pestalotiopsis sp. 9143b]|nr:hypothetical protein KJ359_008543 [Pestalotiopsis sp. 9143b]